MLRRSFVLLAILPLACGKSGPAPAVADAQTATVVKVASPQKQTLHWTVEQPGTIAA
jgi:hypothetical protein